MIECVSETIVFLYRKRTALPAPSCCEMLAVEILGGRCTLQAHFRCTPPVSGSILIWKNVPPGIIFPRRMHPCSENSPVRDYFPEAKASLLREIPRQGLFSRGESIPARRNLPSGIIFSRRKHLCSEKSPVRDYFPKAKASPLREISRQGLFSRGESIPAQRIPPSEIIFPRLALCPQSYTDLSRTRRTQANVYQSYLIRRRTVSFASSAAPEAGTVIPSCTPHYGRNLPVFFPERG